MQILRQTALGVCLLCAAAGIIRIFWPDNRFKPVINTVLLLYILTSVLQMGTQTDWHAVASEIGGFQPTTASPADFSEYEAQLSRQTSLSALQNLLEQNGIQASCLWRDDTLHVGLQNAQDYSAAQALLEANCGTLPYVLEGGE